MKQEVRQQLWVAWGYLLKRRKSSCPLLRLFSTTAGIPDNLNFPLLLGIPTPLIVNTKEKSTEVINQEKSGKLRPCNFCNVGTCICPEITEMGQRWLSVKKSFRGRFYRRASLQVTTINEKEQRGITETHVQAYHQENQLLQFRGEVE